MKKIYKQDTNNWYLERIVFLVAGIFTIFSLGIVFLGYYRFIYFTFFVGLMLINFAVTGYCPMAIILDKLKVKSK